MEAPKFCKQCGNRFEAGDQFCTKCGKKNAPKEVSPKSATTALVLNLLLGTLGAHRFYVNKKWTGLLMLLTLGGVGFWSLVDLIFIVTNKFQDKQEKFLVLTKNASSLKTALMLTSAVIAWFILFSFTIVEVALYFTSGLIYPIEHQLSALRSGDIEKAYSYASKDFQKITPINDFKKFLENYPSLKSNKSSFFNTREVQNNIGLVKGTLTAQDGAKTPIEYRLIKEDNTWKILMIKVLPTGAGITIDHKNNEALNKASSQDKGHALSNLFEAPDNKYSIRYPSDWSYVPASKGTVIFMGKKGTPAQHVNVNIQTVLSKKYGGKYATVKEIVADLKAQLSNKASNGKILAQGEVELSKNPKRFHGEYLIITYDYKNKAFKQMEFILSREDGKVFYTWSYTAHSDQYDANLPIAKAMYESWVID